MDKKVFLVVSLLVPSFAMSAFAKESDKPQEAYAKIEQASSLTREMTIDERVSNLEKEHAQMMAEKVAEKKNAQEEWEARIKDNQRSNRR